MSNRGLLLVEDNPDDEMLTVRALRRFASEQPLTVCHDGRQACSLLGLVETEEAPLDPLPQVVLLDLKIPKIDGHEVLAMIKHNDRTKDIRVMVLTNSDEPFDIDRARISNADAFVTKPVEFNDYLETISRETNRLLTVQD
jgi:two-component system, response regulator